MMDAADMIDHAVDELNRRRRGLKRAWGETRDWRDVLRSRFRKPLEDELVDSERRIAKNRAFKAAGALFPRGPFSISWVNLGAVSARRER